MRAVIRLAHRYAELAREMAAKEKDETRKAEADRNRRDLRMGSRASPPKPPRGDPVPLLLPHRAEIEQVGCGYSEAYLGQNLEPFYQRDKAAGLIGPEEATYLLKPSSSS